MANRRVKINYQGIGEILRGDKMVAELRKRAERVANAAGPGHRVDVQVGEKRARAAVITDTTEAIRNERRDRSLTRAIDAARG